MELEPPPPDRRVVRAARSLYTNRARLATLQERIERAHDSLTTYLGLYGLASALIGGYEVVLQDDELLLTPRPLPGVHQLPLPGELIAAGEPETEGGLP